MAISNTLGAAAGVALNSLVATDADPVSRLTSADYEHWRRLTQLGGSLGASDAHTTKGGKEYSIVVIDFIDPDTADELFMINASVRIANHLTQLMHDTGWLQLHNGTDTRCVNASLIKGIALRAITND